MGMMWWILPVAVAAFGGVFLVTGATHLFRGHPVRAGQHTAGGVAIGAIGLALSLVGLNIQLFSRLTHEGPVAMISVQALNPGAGLYRVTVHRLDGNLPDQTCDITGDEWIIGGRVQKWKAWANILGLDATYSLDQISNKYFTASRADGKTITACDLSGKPPVNSYVPPALTGWVLANFYTEDRRFGSANYMPLADGAQYKLLITQSGFNSEPANAAAKAANDARP